MPNDFLKLLIICVVLVLAGWGMQKLWPGGWSIGAVKQSSAGTIEREKSEIHSSGPIRINELMSANQSALVDENSATPDWIEIANISNNDVDLSGYTLAKSENATNTFVFPSYTLRAGECVIVYADNTLANDANEAFHAPFKLSSAGGTLMLFAPSGTAIDSVNFPSLSSNTAYVRMSQTEWATTIKTTPGYLNTEENYQNMNVPDTSVGIEIYSIVASNTQYAPDENGVIGDYVELHNTTGAAIDISGWFLSDDESSPAKWRFPSGTTVEAGGYLIVHCTGNNHDLHTNFGLSAEGETVILSNSKMQVVDTVTFGLLKTDTAWTKNADGSFSATTPAPHA